MLRKHHLVVEDAIRIEFFNRNCTGISLVCASPLFEFTSDSMVNLTIMTTLSIDWSRDVFIE